MRIPHKVHQNEPQPLRDCAGRYFAQHPRKARQSSHIWQIMSESRHWHLI